MAFAAQLPVVVQADVLALELHVWLAANSDGVTPVLIRASRRRAAGELAEALDCMEASGVFIDWNLQGWGRAVSLKLVRTDGFLPS